MCTDPSDNPVADYNAEPAQIPCAVSDAYKCTHPTFKLNRALINLPIINLTADTAYIQVESGECKIVSDPIEGEVLYPPVQTGDYGQSNATLIASINAAANRTRQQQDQMNSIDASGGNGTKPTHQTAITNENETSISPLMGPWNTVPGQPMNITGKPVAIACNLSAEIPDVLSPTYNASRASLYPSANSDTSGDDSFYIPPPPPSPFGVLTPQTAVCIYNSKDTQSILCLPNGTFPLCGGAFGFSTGRMDSVSFFNEYANLTLDIGQILDSEGDDVTPDTFFDSSTAVGDIDYALSTATSGKDKMEIAIPWDVAPPPAMCIYSTANFGGDVVCIGPGGTNFSSNLINKAASLTLTPGIAAWLYPEYYGNPLGLQVSVSVADLTSLPYRTNQNFKDNIAAAWIYNASSMTD